MAYNLIDERWIPVLRKSGKVEHIAPAEIADRSDPPIRIASPRPDFDGALLEFLIGLAQTAAAPRSESTWRREWEEPPPIAALAKRLASVREAFHLDGDGPRFMQDLTVAKDPKASEEPIGALLIDRIGESGLSESPTLFAKPGLADALGYPMAAGALMAMQTYAPAGGRGQLTSLRGGGPLTTLIHGETLWRAVWINVLPSAAFEELVPGAPGRDGPGSVFPWMAATRVSATNGGRPTPPKAIHPLQCLWGLPRRFRLLLEGDTEGICALTGSRGPVVRSLLSRPDGTSYEGDYRHPWTPYTRGAPGEPWNPKKGSADGLPYRDWPLLVSGTEEQAPAAVVAYFSRLRSALLPSPRLVAFGYAMDKMKPIRWCRGETPVISVPPKLAASFSAETQALVLASEEVRRTLCYQVKAAWSDRPKDLEIFGQVNPAFWSRTEPGFFAAVHTVKAGLEAADQGARDSAREGWLAELHRSAMELFHAFVTLTADLAPPDLRRALHAERALGVFTHPSAAKLRKVVGLTVSAERGEARPSKRSATRQRKEVTR